MALSAPAVTSSRPARAASRSPVTAAMAGLWLVLVLVAGASAGRRESQLAARHLSDSEILEALSLLLAEGEAARLELEPAAETLDTIDFGVEESERQFGPGGPRLLGQEQCEVTGFETRQREECEEVSETECRPVNVTRTRPVISTRCETLLDKEPFIHPFPYNVNIIFSSLQYFWLQTQTCD